MKLQFFGAVGEVTGSCYLLTVGGRRLLVECGLVQGSREQEAANEEPFPFDSDKIDAVVLTHAHLDHAGRLPLLVKRGYRGVIFTHRASVDLADIMLKDAGFINEREAEWCNRKLRKAGERPIEPLYTRQDAEAVMQAFVPLDYKATTEILPGVTLTLHDAGHILGSAIVALDLQERGVRRRLVFSGDLGHRGAPILRDPVRLEQADLVVMESTYGDRMHRSWEETWREMGEIICGARQGRGNILIPSFAVGRTQELLYVFSQHFEAWGLESWEIFLDSPMAIEATEVYAAHAQVYDRQARAAQRVDGSLYDLPNLHFIRESEESMALNRVHAGAIIIAGSGMCTGGRIRHHLRHNLERRDAHVMIVGFQAAGTPGRALVDGARQIHMAGQELQVLAQVHTIGGLSAHADQQGLCEWYAAFRNRPKLMLVHGEPEASEALRQRIADELHADVRLPALREMVML
ncbi:MAG: MBL fold metallo-hydrolase [Chromatiales bacterium]|jgi:metallo-beta-lactamase family protein